MLLAEIRQVGTTVALTVKLVVAVAALATVEARPSVTAATAAIIAFFIGEESSKFKVAVRFLNWRYLTPGQKDQSCLYQAIADQESHHLGGATPDHLPHYMNAPCICNVFGTSK
jgi:hypothetical protein